MQKLQNVLPNGNPFCSQIEYTIYGAVGKRHAFSAAYAAHLNILIGWQSWRQTSEGSFAALLAEPPAEMSQNTAKCHADFADISANR